MISSVAADIDRATLGKASNTGGGGRGCAGNGYWLAAFPPPLEVVPSKAVESKKKTSNIHKQCHPLNGKIHLK